jgi:HEAT repeat protein
MPNAKVLQAAAQRRFARTSLAERVYKGYADQVPELIQQLTGPSKFDHNRAYNLIFQMNLLIVPELVEALHDPSLPEKVVDDVIALLGTTGDERVRTPLWEFFEANKDRPERASRAVRSLACLGDERVLPYARANLENGCSEQVLDLVFALVYLGKLEDIPRLRAIHRKFLGSEKTCLEIRRGAASAILAILGEDSSHMNNRVMEQIRNSFADNILWKDIQAARESTLARVF